MGELSFEDVGDFITFGAIQFTYLYIKIKIWKPGFTISWSPLCKFCPHLRNSFKFTVIKSLCRQFWWVTAARDHEIVEVIASRKLSQVATFVSLNSRLFGGITFSTVFTTWRVATGTWTLYICFTNCVSYLVTVWIYMHVTVECISRFAPKKHRTDFLKQ